MCPKIKVFLAPKTFMPMAEVPSHSIWELVEYLACRGTKVQYRYGAAECLVLFPTLDAPAAQQILDDWAASHSAELHCEDLKEWRSEPAAQGRVSASRHLARADV